MSDKANVREMNPDQAQGEQKKTKVPFKDRVKATMNKELKVKHALAGVAITGGLVAANELVGFALRNKVPGWPKLMKYKTAGTDGNVIKGNFAKK